MHTCHYRNELVGAVHGCTKCRLKSNHEIAGVSPYHSSSSLPPTHPLSSASPPSPLFSYSATPLLPSLSLALVLRRFSFLVRSLARSPACLLACFPENLSTRVWLSYVFATHGGPVQISDEERIRVYVFWIPVDGPLHWRIEGLARVWILCLGRGGGGRDSLAGNYIVWS